MAAPNSNPISYIVLALEKQALKEFLILLTYTIEFRLRVQRAQCQSLLSCIYLRSYPRYVLNAPLLNTACT